MELFAAWLINLKFYLLTLADFLKKTDSLIFFLCRVFCFFGPNLFQWTLRFAKGWEPLQKCLLRTTYYDKILYVTVKEPFHYCSVFEYLSHHCVTEIVHCSRKNPLIIWLSLPNRPTSDLKAFGINSSLCLLSMLFTIATIINLSLTKNSV